MLDIKKFKISEKQQLYGLVGGIAFLLLFIVYGIFTYVTTKSNLENRLYGALEKINTLESNLSELNEKNLNLEQALYSEQQINTAFEEQINGIFETVGSLEKLTKTDTELLQKYSKVYFLNEHYIPEKLVLVNEQHSYEKDREQYFHSQLLSYLELLIGDAKNDDINLLIISAFRSFDTQADLKGNYSVTYGTGANTFSADQGYSEHQLGTTVDFTTEELGTGFTNFNDTSAYEWLVNNAHKYGFVLSYPESNDYYQFEPWHWRFVGTGLASDLHKDNKHFYDLDQREIDVYLIKFFD